MKKEKGQKGPAAAAAAAHASTRTQLEQAREELQRNAATIRELRAQLDTMEPRPAREGYGGTQTTWQSRALQATNEAAHARSTLDSMRAAAHALAATLSDRPDAAALANLIGREMRPTPQCGCTCHSRWTVGA